MLFFTGIVSTCHFLWVCKLNPKLTSIYCIFKEALGSDGNKDTVSKAGEEEIKLPPDSELQLKVSNPERTIMTPAETLGETNPRQPDGAGCCEPQDSEKERPCKIRCVYSPELHRNVWDVSLFYSSPGNSWYSCATMDTTAHGGLSLGASRPLGPAGLPVSQQQHTLQVHRRHVRFSPGTLFFHSWFKDEKKSSVRLEASGMWYTMDKYNNGLLQANSCKCVKLQPEVLLKLVRRYLLDLSKSLLFT